MHPREKKIEGNENTAIATVGAPVKTKLRVSASGTGALNLHKDACNLASHLTSLELHFLSY